jgi:hypothetical protein
MHLSICFIWFLRPERQKSQRHCFQWNQWKKGECYQGGHKLYMAKNPCFLCIPWIQAGNDLKGDGRNGPVNHGKVVVDPLRIRRIHFPNRKEVPPRLISQPGIWPSPGDENRRTALILRRKKGWEQIRQSVFGDKYPTLPIVECRFCNACWIWPSPGDENRRTALILRREKG